MSARVEIGERSPVLSDKEHRILNLHRTGLDDADIQHKLHISEDEYIEAVSEIRSKGHRWDAPNERRPWTSEDEQTLMRRRQEGADYCTIAKELGRPVSSIGTKLSWLRRNAMDVVAKNAPFAPPASDTPNAEGHEGAQSTMLDALDVDDKRIVCAALIAYAGIICRERDNLDKDLERIEQMLQQ